MELNFETVKNALHLAGPQRQMISNLVRKININVVTWSFENIVNLERKNAPKMYMNNKTNSNGI